MNNRATIKARMKDDLVRRYSDVLPGELDAYCDSDRDYVVGFLESIQGTEVTLVLFAGDAFEINDDNVWLPNELWDKIS